METISETAFLVNWARANDPILSKDPWAYLWVTEKSKVFGEGFKKRVSRWEEWLVCLRNRYFTDRLEEFEAKHSSFTFLNIAAGFTSYPWNLNSRNRVIEIDYPHVIRFREEKLAGFESENKIPKRPIQFVPMNLNGKGAIDDIQRIIKSQKQPLFVLLEGILYYLKRQTVDQLFEMLGNTLPPCSRVGTISWPHKIKNQDAMQKMKQYFEEELGFPAKEYVWLDDEWFETISGLKMIDRTDYPQLDQQYCHPPHNFSREHIIDESFHLLERV